MGVGSAASGFTGSGAGFRELSFSVVSGFGGSQERKHFNTHKRLKVVSLYD